MTLTAQLDSRFSQATEPVDWAQAQAALASAELFWLTTVRTDGRPHVTPLVGVWISDDDSGAFVFCTGPEEQKAVNLQRNADVAVTTGVNTWQDGLDIVVEGTAERVRGRDTLTAFADAYRDKYGADWDIPCDDDVFDPDGQSAIVFRVRPVKVLAFAKSPHGQTRFLP
jgi:pyridoxine/pyridoxamine 5'-phosphate oxidase